jgi:outer membrane protein OmpA-like peptidoglycan-associated protein
MARKIYVALFMLMSVLFLDGCAGGGKVRGIDASATERGVTIRLPESVLFAFSSSTLRENAQPLIDRLATVIKSSTRPVEVYGYTDSVGNSEYNQQLATQRATVVRQALIDRGIAASRITAYGRGDANPVASNATEEGRALNRRVEVLLVGERLSNVTAAGK